MKYLGKIGQMTSQNKLSTNECFSIRETYKVNLKYQENMDIFSIQQKNESNNF
jgi:hypothetical protein